MSRERIESTPADVDGVHGDRVWAVQDAAGKLGSATRYVLAEVILRQ